MAASARHFVKHWKKYTLGGVAYLFGVRFAAKRHREQLVTRDFCKDAKALSDRPCDHQNAPLKKVFVFLNPEANHQKCMKYFKKYASPILQSSDMDVTVVTSRYEGHISSLVKYINIKDTAAVIVAGGDGTVNEVVSGLIKHHNATTLQRLPVGIIPLGRENRVYHRLFPHQTSAVRWKAEGGITYVSHFRGCVGEAARATLGSTVKPVPVIELQPEEGNKVYSLSGVSWGAFKDAEQNRDGFRLFGPLRLFLSYANVALRKWPHDLTLHLWSSEVLAVPPSTDTPLASLPSPTLVAASLRDTPLTQATPPHTTVEEDKKQEAAVDVSIPKSLGMGTESWHLFRTDTIAMNVKTEGSKLLISCWPGPDDVSKKDFLQQGWQVDSLHLLSSNLVDERSLSVPGLTPTQFHTEECIIRPQSRKESWLSVDGEGYEAVPMRVRVLPDKLQVLAPHTTETTNC